MGKILKAQCDCGFESKKIMVGCGMAEMNAYILVACSSCHNILSRKENKLPHNCRKCGKPVYLLNNPENYSPPEIHKRLGNNDPWDVDCLKAENDEWGDENDELMPEMKYRCPKCDKFQMKLIVEGWWD